MAAGFFFAVFFLLTSLAAAAEPPRSMSEDALHSGIFVDRAVVAYSDGRYEDALKELQQALRLDPENIDARYYQGLTYAALTRNAEAYAALERAKQLRPSDIDVAFQLGVLHYGDKQYDKAEPYLREVYRANPKHPNIGYYLGVIEFNKQNFREALAYFKGDVPSDPEFEQLNRFYTALTLTRLGATAEAKAEVDLAIRAQPASPLTAPAQRLGEILTGAQREEKRFSGQLRLGVYFDSNVPVVPLPSGDSEVKTFRSKNGRDSWGTLAALDLEYKWLKTAAWEGSISHHFLQTYNYNPRVRDFNTQENMPTLSIINNGALPVFLGSMAYSAGAQAAYDFISLGNAPFIQRGIVSPYLTLIENAGNATTLLYRFQYKDFYHDERAATSDDIQDAANNTIGWLHFFLFEKSRHYIKIGYQYDDENARGRNWDYRGHRLLAGFQYTLPWDVRFRYDLDYHWRFYDHKNTLHPDSTKSFVRRRDNEPIHLVGVAKDFRFVAPFTAAVEYFYDRGHSNIDLYDFRRHNVTMSLAWHF